jgi:hypothetical protein
MFAMSAQSIVEQLLSSNAQWAKAVKETDSSFFPDSAKGQTPQVNLLNMIKRLRLIDFPDPLDWLLGLSRSRICNYCQQAW